MSFEPTIIIRKSSFEKRINLLEREKDKDSASSYLLTKYKEMGVFPKIGDEEMFICDPEFSNFNEQVREKLQEFDIEFDIDN